MLSQHALSRVCNANIACVIESLLIRIRMSPGFSHLPRSVSFSFRWIHIQLRVYHCVVLLIIDINTDLSIVLEIFLVGFFIPRDTPILSVVLAVTWGLRGYGVVADGDP